MQFEIGFGNGTQTLCVADKNLLACLMPNEILAEKEESALVRDALASPCGAARLSELASGKERIVILTSDITRPLPSYKLLPAVLEELYAAGVSPKNITVVFALGSHRKQTEAEMIKLVGETVYRSVRCIDGDPDDFVSMGVTSYGTPVEITRIVAEADFRIGLGNVEFHYFAGYSGGAKAVMPGVSTRAAIQSNHSRMVLPEAAAGRLEGNPVRMDIEEAISFCPLHYILNVVLDEHKKIVYAAAGHFITAHRAACAYLDGLYKTEIPARADIVVASQGGAPKDLNLYQTQKALDNAKHAVKKGGTVILVGACAEGLGEEVFEEWMRAAKKPADLITRIRQEFRLGGHKAAAIAMVREDADIFLVSQMDDALVRACFMEPYKTVQEAYDAALKKQGEQATAIIMPYAGSTLPYVRALAD